MRIRELIFLAVLALPVSLPSAGMTQPAEIVQTQRDELTLTLEEAVALALRDNRELRSVRLWRVVDRFDLFLAHRAYLPSGGVSLSAVRRKSGTGETVSEWTASPGLSWHSPIGTNAQLGWTHREPLSANGPASRSFSATVRQPLLRGAGIDVNMAPLRQARIAEAMARLAEEDAVAGLVERVTLSYRALIQAQEAVELARLALERGRHLLETNQMLIQAGRMAAADIVQTQSEVANQEVALLETERALAGTRRNLLLLLALEPSTPIRVVAETEVAPVDIDTDEAVNSALEHRTDIRASKLNFERLDIAATLARNSRLWDVSVVAAYDRLDGGPGGRDVAGHSIGLQVDIPVGDFSGRRNMLSARTALHSARLAYDESLENIEGQVREAVADVASRWRQLEAAQRAQALAARSLEIQQERLRAGRASNFEVLTLQSSLRAADAQALAARIAYLNALTALDRQTGRTLQTWRISVD